MRRHGNSQASVPLNCRVEAAFVERRAEALDQV